MKRLIATILISAVTISTSAFASTEERITEIQNQIMELQKELNTLKAEAIGEDVINVSVDGRFSLLYENHSIESDYAGNKCLRIVFSFTNNSDRTSNFESLAWIKAFQDGIEMDNDFLMEDELANNGYKDVQPGATIQISRVFELKGNSPVQIDVKCNEFFSSNEPLMSQIINIE